MSISGRLFAYNIHAAACMFRQSPNAKGIYFAPVVGLLCAHCHARTSTERERQRKVGQPVRPYVFIFKTTMFTAACVSVPPLCIVFLDFPSARLAAAERRYMVAQSAKPSFASRASHIFRAGCRSAVRALPCAHIDRARTPTEGRTACPTLCFYIQDNIIRKTLRVCSVMFSWTFAVAPLVAAPRLLKGRRRGRARADFRIEPYAHCAV